MSEAADFAPNVVTPSITPLSWSQGEDHHAKGNDAERTIIRWLRMTTRIRTFYERGTEMTRQLLIYKWPYSKTTFSFDFGGEFRGGDIDGQCFLAEAKAHETSKNLPKEFRKFIGQCYALCTYHAAPPSHFLWISFSPHGTDKWESIASTQEVRDAILHADNLQRLFGTASADEAQIDEDAVRQVSDSVWMLIYSSRLQTLSLETEHFGLIQRLIAEQAVAL